MRIDRKCHVIYKAAPMTGMTDMRVAYRDKVSEAEVIGPFVSRSSAIYLRSDILFPI